MGLIFFVAIYPELADGAERDPDQGAITVSRECTVSASDEAWIEASIASWQSTRRALIPSQAMPETTALFFDDDCVYRTDHWLQGESKLRFSATRHAGTVELPSGAHLPAGVASFAAPHEKNSVFFIMALPSIWEASGKTFAFDRLSFLTAIMIHEMSHVVQFDTYLKQSAEVESIELLGNNVNDDIVQDRFAADESFSASVDEEVRLLFAAAAAPTMDERRHLTRRALAMMRARQAEHYTGNLRALAQLEDIFLTLEGSGQFAALMWLTHPEGGGIAYELARHGFGESVRFWSQRQGLALFLVLDRIAPGWRATVYGDGRRTVLQLLDDALK